MIKKLLIILPLYAAWPPNASACHVGGKDLLNFKSRTTHVSDVAPVPYEGNESKYGNTIKPLATVTVEVKKDEMDVDLTSLDSNTVVVPSASGGSK